MQILNRHDTCCFGEKQHVGPNPHYENALREYEENVRQSLLRLGGDVDAFHVYIDEDATDHTITGVALRDVILPALKGD